jgi:hypothetical protein
VFPSETVPGVKVFLKKPGLRFSGQVFFARQHIEDDQEV